MITNKLEQFLDWLWRQGEYLTEGPSWLVKTTIAATLLSLLLGFPRLEVLTSNYQDVPEMQAVMEKVGEPFAQHDYPDGSHEEKLTFRMTVPLIGHYGGLGPGALKFVEVLFAIALLALAGSLGAYLTTDRLCGVWSALLVATIFSGNCGFTEFRGMFDAVAICLLVAAMRTTNPILNGILVLLASWVDERGALAAGIVFFHHVVCWRFELSGTEDCFVKKYLSRRALTIASIGLCPVIYLAMRKMMMDAYDLKSTAHGVEFWRIADQMNNFGIGCWSALEGGWLLVLAGGIAFAIGRNWLLLFGYCGIMGLVLCGAMSVIDLTRSAAYILPAFFVGIAQMKRFDEIKNIRRLLFVGFLISAIWPCYYAGGKGEIWWYSPPLPIQVLRICTQL